MPMPQILEEIVEIEAIVDIPVLQFVFIFHVNCSFFCCCIERCTSFSVYYFLISISLFDTLKREIVGSLTFY